jgi:rhomboid protease GluP
MEKYLKRYIQKLNELFGYRIAELEEIRGLATEWSAVRVEHGNARAVAFAELGKTPPDESAIRERIMAQVGTSGVDIVIIYAVEGNYSGALQEFIESGRKGIILDVTKNEVIYYSSVDETAVREATASAHYLKAEGIRKKPGNNLMQFYATIALIAVNIAMYAVTAFLSRDLVNSNINVLIELGAKDNSLIAAGQYWRLITCVFLHGGIFHLAINMYSLYAVGPVIERFFGRKKYLIVYFFSGVCSSLLSYYMTPDVSIGASGAIFGILGACLVFAVEMKDQIGKEFMINVIAVIALNLFLGFSVAMIDNYGHIGGLLGGIASSFLLFKKKKQA